MPLTEREKEFLSYLKKGYSQSEAGKAMGISRQRANELWRQLLNSGAINVVIEPKEN